MFNAGPSFQDQNINWDSDDEKILAYKSICRDIVVEQYRAIAQVAAIKSCYTTKPVCLNLTMVGQGAFKNPPEIMTDVVKVVYDELKDSNVKVYLHDMTEIARSKWEDNLKKGNVPYEVIDIKNKSMI